MKAPVAEALIPDSYASESAVAWVMNQKYQNGLPLNRQEQDWEQLGVALNRATLANWIIYCAEHYFSPAYDYFHRQLLERQYLIADETRVQVLKERERNPETDSWMWLFRSGEDDLPPIVLYHYTETRAKYHAERFLNGFTGYLEKDGYQEIINFQVSNDAPVGLTRDATLWMPCQKARSMITAILQYRGFNSALNFLNANGIQKPKTIQLSREKNSDLQKKSRCWKHSGNDLINRNQTRGLALIKR